MEARKIKELVLFLLLAFALVVSGCGGDGSSSSSTTTSADDTATAELTTVSGVAAAGAPLAGYVSLKDSQGNPTPALTTLLDSDGRFSFDVTDLIPPFYLKAEGVAGNTGYELHSVVGAAGTANVNPLTEAQVAAATGVDPAELYDDPSANTMTAEEMDVALDQAADDLIAMLQPLLDAWEAPVLNPITDVFVADGTGLDQLFDATSLTTSDTGIEVVDRKTETILATADFNADTGGFTTTDSLDTDEATAVIATTSDLDQIRTFLGEWLTTLKQVSADFATDTIDQQTALERMLVNYVDEQSFGYNNGLQLQELLVEEYLDDAVFLNAIQAVTGVSIAKYDDVANTYWLDFVLVLQISSETAQTTMPYSAVVAKQDDGSWKLTGNGYFLGEMMDAVYFNRALNYYSEQTTELVLLEVELEDPADVFASAVITGPGLPAEGLLLSADQYNWELKMSEDQMACRRPAQDGSCLEYAWNAYELSDAVIADMPEVCTYDVTLHFADGSPDEVHSFTMPAKPLLMSVDATDYFTYINNDMALNLQWPLDNLIGQSYMFNYTTPIESAAYKPVVAGIEGWFEWYNPTDNSYGNVENWEDGLTLGSNLEESVAFPAIPAGAVLQWGDVETWSMDALWRNYEVNYYFRD